MVERLSWGSTKYIVPTYLNIYTNQLLVKLACMDLLDVPVGTIYVLYCM